MSDNSNFYVYIIYRPDGVTPCYVGKGRGRRIFKHEWKSTNPHLANIIKKNGGKLPKRKIAENLTENEAFALEISTIASIGREVNGGPLVNMTDGGEGISGYKFPQEIIDRISKVHIGNTYRLGMKASEETKALQSSLKIGKTLSEETRAKIGRPGRYVPPEVGRKISASKIGYRHTPEAIQKMSDNARSSEPEVRAKISAGVKLALADPTVKLKMRNAKLGKKFPKSKSLEISP